jgi:hypothetical protein
MMGGHEHGTLQAWPCNRDPSRSKKEKEKKKRHEPSESNVLLYVLALRAWSRAHKAWLAGGAYVYSRQARFRAPDFSAESQRVTTQYGARVLCVALRVSACVMRADGTKFARQEEGGVHQAGAENYASRISARPSSLGH